MTATISGVGGLCYIIQMFISSDLCEYLALNIEQAAFSDLLEDTLREGKLEFKYQSPLQGCKLSLQSLKSSGKAWRAHPNWPSQCLPAVLCALLGRQIQ